MIVEEHTAQLATKKASSIQQDFIRGKVNALSCSTTFELGVDVGDLEAVFLRNVPPGAANYVQRAGRAGRRLGAAALVVTFAQRRNHDLTWFRDPRDLIDGHVPTPILNVENPVIARRHAHSVAFAEFEKSAGEHKTVAEFMIDDPLQDLAFNKWIETHPSSVKSSLERVLPKSVAETIGVDTWEWARNLFEPDPETQLGGWLGLAGAIVRNDIAELEELQREAAAQEQYPRANAIKKQGTTIRGQALINFLGSRNVLPKYGFPVDVVGLDLSKASAADGANLDLNRDLSLALVEFAPGERVVAGKKLWESIGVVIPSERGLPTYTWGICQSCGRYHQRIGEAEQLEPCHECGGDVKKQGVAVIPVFGFVGVLANEKLGESRPPRRAYTQQHFGSFAGPIPEFEPYPALGPKITIRQSSQGRVVVINSGPNERHYYCCEWCGFAQRPIDRGGTFKNEHDNARAPGRRKCRGKLQPRDLAHEYLTDVLEINVAGTRASLAAATSATEALIAAAPRVGIVSGELSGVPFAYGGDLRITLFDTVPGGAGHAKRVAKSLPELVSAAVSVVSSCSCGIDTACYACLQSYRNQRVHDQLTREGALSVLSEFTL